MTELQLHQRPDHVVHGVEKVEVIDGDPFVVTAVKPKRDRGVFLDWSQAVEWNEVVVTIERFDGNPA